jgi:hypothetical protein
MLGMVVNTACTPLEASALMLMPENVDQHMMYTAQQRLNGYTEVVRHAIRWKVTFDKKVRKSKTGKVIFTKGQLMQVFNSGLSMTLHIERKLQVIWLGPH